MRNLIVCLMLATPAAAQDPITGDAFETFATGKTLGYSVGAQSPYGTERYMANRRVIWTTIDGRCTTGIWFDSKDQICFRYDDDNSHKCWRFYPEGDQLIGQFEDDTNAPYLITLLDDDDLFQCNQLSS